MRYIISVLLENLDGSANAYRANVDKTDNHIPEEYFESNLLKIILGAGTLAMKYVYKRGINDAFELQDRVIKNARSRRHENTG